MSRIDLKDFFEKSGKPHIASRYSIKNKCLKIKPWDSVKHHLAIVSLAPPNSQVDEFTVGSAIVYKRINERADSLCERSMLPDKDVRTMMNQKNISAFSLDTGQEIKDFDIICLSLYFNFQYFNIIPYLRLAGIPERSIQRDESWPLVIAGGQALYNPEPVAEFIDLIMIGEGDDWFDVFIPVWESVKGLPRQKQLEEIAKRVPGAYIPRFYDFEFREDGGIKSIKKNNPNAPDRVKRQWCKDISKSTFKVDDYQNQEQRGTIELARGCGFMCSFCQLAHTMKPRRCLPKEKAFEAVKSYANVKKREIKLFAPEEGSIPDYIDVANFVVDSGYKIGSEDCRFDCYSEEWGNAIKRGHADNICLGVEGFSDRQRAFVNKCISKEQIVNVMQHLFKNNFKKVKLFFMCGYPDTDYDDVYEFREMMESILKMRNEMGSISVVQLSITMLNAQPFTPMQWFGTEFLTPYDEYIENNVKLKEYEANKYRLGQIQKGEMRWDMRTMVYHCNLLKAKYGNLVLGRNMKRVTTEFGYIVNRSDRRLWKVLMSMANTGFCYDGIAEKGMRENFFAACKIFKIPYERYKQTWDVNDILPWDVIDIAIGKDMKEYLKREYSRMKREVDERREKGQVDKELKSEFNPNNPAFIQFDLKQFKSDLDMDIPDEEDKFMKSVGGEE